MFRFVFASIAHHIEQLFGMKMVVNDFALVGKIDHIKRMQQVLTVDVYRIASVLQNEDDTRTNHWGTLYHGTHAHRSVLYIGMLFHVREQVQSKFIESQVHDVDTRIHIFNVHHSFLQPSQLVASVFQISFFVYAKQIIIARSRKYGSLHAALYTSFQLDVFVQLHIRPVVDQLYLLVT